VLLEQIEFFIIFIHRNTSNENEVDFLLYSSFIPSPLVKRTSPTLRTDRVLGFLQYFSFICPLMSDRLDADA
jgi:hypothetical protein